MKVVLIAVAAVAVATSSAVGARSTASPFELVVFGSHEAVSGPAFPFGFRHKGTFVASAPFCSSGIFWDLTNDMLESQEDTRLYTCGDGSGTLTTAQEDWFEHKEPFTSDWRITAGTGRYADLRGGGTYRGELLSGGGLEDEDPLATTYRATFTGVVAFDAVAPTIRISSAKATKVQAAGAYSIRVVFSVRDNEPQDSLTWLVALEPSGGGLYLAQKHGVTTERVTTTLRAKPGSGARGIRLNIRAEDAVGNWRWVERLVKLPR